MPSSLGIAVVYVAVTASDVLGRRARARPRPWPLVPLVGGVLTLLSLPAVVVLEVLLQAFGLGRLTSAVVAVVGVCAGVMVWASGGRIRPLGERVFVRGAVVGARPGRALGVLARRVQRRSPDALEPVVIGGVPIPIADEPKHFKFIGTTGTGKSSAIGALLATVLARGDRAVIADPDGGYLARFYDAARGDVILNPFDARSPVWNPFLELRAVHESADLARSLVGEGGDEGWADYARVFLTALLDRLKDRPNMTAEILYGYLALAPVEMLAELLADSPAAPYLATGAERMFASVRSVAVTRLAALDYVGRQTGTPFSVRRWIETGRGVLFLPYTAGEIAALRQLIATWLRLAIFQTMQNRIETRTWFVVDELDALGRIDGLKDALARLRKFGGRCVLGFQSIAQVSGTYGSAEAQTLVENCGTTLVLRCSAAEGGGTAAFAARLVGEREVASLRETRSRTHFTPTVSRHWDRVREPALLTSEIEALPDLTGYLKKPSSPEWWRVAIVPLPSLGIASPTGTDGEAEALTPLPEPVPDDLRSAVGAEGGVEAPLGTKKNPAGEADGVS